MASGHRWIGRTLVQKIFWESSGLTKKRC
jgi:hypothetical protein